MGPNREPVEPIRPGRVSSLDLSGGSSHNIEMGERGSADHHPGVPASYNRWKWRVLLAFAGFYLFVYLGRFNFWPAAPVIKEDLELGHVQIGVINALLLWGFALGDLVHGRLAEAYGMRLWVMLGACLTAGLNWAASYGTSTLSFALPWCVNGFVNAACWSPGIALISQWWPRGERGRAMGIVMMSAGGAMLLMWLVTGWVVSKMGWQAAFRYPPLAIAGMGVLFYVLSRDRPRDVGLPDYVEEDRLSARAEELGQGRLRGLGPYSHLLTDVQFQIACHVKGLENVVRYGLTTWVPLYYFERAGLDITSTVLVTTALPAGYLAAPVLGGLVSDRLLKSARRPVVMASCGISALALVGIALAPPDNLYLGAVLLLVAGFAMSLSPMGALAVDIAGRHMAGTSSGVLDAHGYLYAGLQAVIFSIVLEMAGAPWEAVFLAMASTRVLSGALIAFVRV